jgi:hypothetical protein
MGTWPRRTYVQYVETHAQARDIVPLQYPYDEALDDKNPKIFLSYFSMPFWMDTLDIAFDDREATFRRNLHAYRAAATDHVSQVRKQAHDIIRLGPGTGQALFDELRVTGHWLRILPNWNWLESPNAYAVPDAFILAEPGGADTRTWQAATAKGAPIPIKGGGPMRDDAGKLVLGRVGVRIQ